MVAGENEHVKLLGIPAHESERTIELLKATDCGCAVTVKCPDFPAAIVMAAGDAPKDKAGELLAAHAEL